MSFRASAALTDRRAVLVGALVVVGFLFSGAGLTAAAAAPSVPSVFMTTVDGTGTNPASYPAKDDVYLSAASCPPGGNGLSAGQYYFEVRDQTGTQVLSTDLPGDRWFEVAANGSITNVPNHNSGTNACPGGPGGLVVKVQPFVDLPPGQTQYTIRVTSQAAVGRCPPDQPFCDAGTVSTAAFAIAPNTVTPSPSPSDSGAPSASDSATAASASPSDAQSTPPSPSPPPASAPASSAPGPSSAATARPTSRPTQTPVAAPPLPAAGIPGAGTGGSGGGPAVNPPAATPAGTPYVIPSGFFACKRTEVVTPAGCKTQAQLAAQFGGAQPGTGAPPPGPIGGPVTGPTTPPLPGSTVLGVPPTLPPASGSAPGGSTPAAPATASGVPAASARAAAATPTLVAAVDPASSGGAPASADQHIPGTNASPSQGDASASGATPSSGERNLNFILLGLLAAIAIAVLSVVARIIGRNRRRV